MTAIANVHDIGGFSGASRLLLSEQAGTWNDNGNSVDTIPQGAQQLGSGLVILEALTNVAGGDTCTVGLVVQDAPDNGAGAPGVFANVNANVLMTAADLADGLPAVPTLSLDAATPEGQFTFTLPLHRLRRHVRVQTTVTQSNAARTCNIGLELVSGGNVLVPV